MWRLRVECVVDPLERELRDLARGVRTTVSVGLQRWVEAFDPDVTVGLYTVVAWLGMWADGRRGTGRGLGTRTPPALRVASLRIWLKA